MLSQSPNNTIRFQLVRRVKHFKDECNAPNSMKEAVSRRFVTHHRSQLTSFLKFLLFTRIPQIFRRSDNATTIKRQIKINSKALFETKCDVDQHFASFTVCREREKEASNCLDEKNKTEKESLVRLCNCLSSNAYLRYFRFRRCVEASKNNIDTTRALFYLPFRFIFLNFAHFICKCHRNPVRRKKCRALRGIKRDINKQQK